MITGEFAAEGTAWPELHRVRRAIVVLDMVESVRLLQLHEDRAIQRWLQFVKAMRTEVLPPHGGRLVKSLGDGMLLEFDTVLAALAVAHEAHRCMARFNQGVEDDARIELRAGVHLADVVIDLGDLFGAGVNLAARLAALAGPGEVVVSAEVRDHLVADVDARIEDLGDCYLKHLPEPVRAFRVHPATAADAAAVLPVRTIDGEGEGRSPSTHVRPVLAVLPFQAAGAAQAPSLAGDLITSQLHQHLSKSNAVDLISRMSTGAFRGRNASAALLRRHLGAHFVLSGSCRESGGDVAFSVELIDTRHGHAVWADGGRVPLPDLLSGRSERLFGLASAALGALLSHQLQQALSAPLYSLEDHALLINGIALMHSNSRPAFERARQALDAARERLPRHPEPLAWMAKWHVLRTHQGWSDDLALETGRARDCTSRALDLDPGSALAHTMDGLVNVHLLKQVDVGRQRYAQALVLDPNDSLAWLLQGALRAFQGDGDQAVHDTRHAITLSPIDPLRYYYDSLAASAALTAGDNLSAISLAQRSLQANATHLSTLRVLTIAQALAGDTDEARSSAERVLRMDPGFSVRRFCERAPDGAQSVVRRFADALRQAGVPE